MGQVGSPSSVWATRNGASSAVNLRVGLQIESCAGLVRSVRVRGGLRLSMMPEDQFKFLQAASNCLDLARRTQDEQMRTALLVLAQQWLDLAQDRSDDGAFLTALEAFRDWQMQKKHKKQ
jgi:hypothetical protein